MRDMIAIGPEKFFKDCFSLAKEIYEDGYRPDLLVGVWRGGAAPAITISEYLNFKGIDHNHTSIKSEAYKDIEEIGEVELEGVEHINKKINKFGFKRVLLVDDIIDTGKSLENVVKGIKEGVEEIPEIRIAVLCQRSDREQDIEPDYLCDKVGKWVVFPHQVEGMSEEEIKKYKPWASELI